MNHARVHARQTLQSGLDEVFDFFSDPRNLGKVTPAWLHFRILTPTVVMASGAIIDYQLRLGLVPFRWTSEITVYEPGFRFVDEQRTGPYRFWVHEHRFSTSGRHTVVEDLVRYRPPGGRLVDVCLVRPQVYAIFRHRQRILGQRFGRVEEDRLQVHWTGDDVHAQRSRTERPASRPTEERS
jgi:ligand-binding SRPBCC domain-containing protein